MTAVIQAIQAPFPAKDGARPTEEKTAMQSTMEMKLAVLIDADNVPHDRITGMMKEIARYGTPTIKRIYGDWTKPDLKGWKNILLSHAITPVQQYRYTVGKNATDSAMIIDAMDMLYAGNLDGFCIVSSDSDFTRLAIRLRESGKRVFGMGERKTPKPFIVACDKFTYIEIIDMAVEKTEDEPEPVRRISGARTASTPVAASGKAEGTVKLDAAAVQAGKTETGKGNGDRFGGLRQEIRQGAIRPEAAGQSEAKAVAGQSEAKAAAGQSEAKAVAGQSEAKAVAGLPEAKAVAGQSEAKAVAGLPEAKGAEDKTADRKTETAAASGGRQEPGKGRSRRRNVAQRVEERPEAVLTTQVQPIQPAAVETVTPESGQEHPGKTEHAAEPASASHSAIGRDRGAEASHPIVEAVNREIIDLIGTSITDLADENGWAFLGDVGTLIAKKKPDFDPRNYGFVKLTPLIRSLDMFELDIRETSQFHIKHVYVRNRKRSGE